jgi:hypothetical protein
VEVGLAPNQLSSARALELLDGLLGLPRLCSLDLSGNGIGAQPDALRHLDHGLRHCSSIQLLYLRTSQLKPKGT